MDDTDRVLRVTTPFIRPTTADLFERPVTAETRQSALEEPTFEDPTPTTAPSWAPRRRLARGTMVPPTIPSIPGLKSARLRSVVRPSLDTPAGLAIAYVDSPRQWGYVVRIDLEPRLPAVSGEVTAPVRRIGGAVSWAPLVAGGIAATLLLSAALVLSSSGGGGRGATAAPALAPARVAALVPAPAPAAPAHPPIVTPIVIQLEDHSADDAAADEIEMPAETVDAAPAAPTHAILMIGSKPPCRIYIDGKDTGLTTPQRAVRVGAGRRTITLRNDALKIKHTATVNVTGGRKAKLIRDLTAQLDE